MDETRPVDHGNGYTYVGNNPSGATDPTGAFSCGRFAVACRLAVASYLAAVGTASQYAANFIDRHLELEKVWECVNGIMAGVVVGLAIHYSWALAGPMAGALVQMTGALIGFGATLYGLSPENLTALCGGTASLLTQMGGAAAALKLVKHIGKPAHDGVKKAIQVVPIPR